MRIFDIMKTRVNLTIENNLLTLIKRYARSKQTSVSELVEEYFKDVMKPVKRKNILKEMESLPKPDMNLKGDLKELFYQDQAEKYGF